jgi:hypothetical protein
LNIVNPPKFDDPGRAAFEINYTARRSSASGRKVAGGRSILTNNGSLRLRSIKASVIEHIEAAMKGRTVPELLV